MMEIYIRNRYDAEGSVLPRGYQAKEAPELKEFLKELYFNQKNRAEESQRHPCDNSVVAVQ